MAAIFPRCLQPTCTREHSAGGSLKLGFTNPTAHVPKYRVAVPLTFQAFAASCTAQTQRLPSMRGVALPVRAFLPVKNLPPFSANKAFKMDRLQYLTSCREVRRCRQGLSRTERRPASPTVGRGTRALEPWTRDLPHHPLSRLCRARGPGTGGKINGRGFISFSSSLTRRDSQPRLGQERLCAAMHPPKDNEGQPN